MSGGTFFAGIARSPTVAVARACFDPSGRSIEGWKGHVAVGRSTTRTPTCEDCFFSRNLLCALPEQEPCATFRPDHPDGPAAARSSCASSFAPTGGPARRGHSRPPRSRPRCTRSRAGRVPSVRVRLTILGKSPSWQDRDGACSGYLVEAGGLRLLIDCGNGVFAKLRRHAEYERVDAVLVSHLHADHLLDLVPFAYALTYGPPLRSGRPALHAPPGAALALRRLCGAWGSETLIEDAFELREYDPDAGLELDGVRIRFQPSRTTSPSYAIELRADGGGAG